MHITLKIKNKLKKKIGDQFELLSSEYYDSETMKFEEGDEEEEDEKDKIESDDANNNHGLSIELDLGLHDLDSSDTEDFEHLNYDSTPNNKIEEKIQHKKQRQKEMNFKAVNSYSTSTTLQYLDDEQNQRLSFEHNQSSHSLTTSCTTIEEEQDEEVKEPNNEKENKLNILLNDTKYENMLINEDVLTQKKFIKEIMDEKNVKTPQILSKALNISVTSIDDHQVKDNEYDSDYGTAYNDKYCAINQCSPSVQSPVECVGDINEIFNVQSLSSQTTLPSVSPNQLNPSLLFGKLDQFSHSETYQSQSIDSMQSMMDTNDNMIVSELKEEEESVNHKKSDHDQDIVIHSKSEEIQPNINKNRHKKWFNFLSSASSKEESNSNNNNMQRRKSTLSALFTSFMNHNSSLRSSIQILSVFNVC